MKKLIFTMLIALTATAAMAQDAMSYTKMYLFFMDGSVQLFDLTGDMVLKNRDGMFIVKVGGTEYEYDRLEVSHIKYSGEVTKVEQVKIEDKAMPFKMQGDQLLISATQSSGVLEVFSFAGYKMLGTSIDERTKSVSIAHLPKGIYVVRLNGKTAKIRVK